ncbi:hypothetical protein ACOSQ2_022547 [Xanthoceras sorbifolium]
MRDRPFYTTADENFDSRLDVLVVPAREKYTANGKEIEGEHGNNVDDGFMAPSVEIPSSSRGLHETNQVLNCDTVGSHAPSHVNLHAWVYDNLVVSSNQVVVANNSVIEMSELQTEHITVDKENGKDKSISSLKKGKGAIEPMSSVVIEQELTTPIPLIRKSTWKRCACEFILVMLR